MADQPTVLLVGHLFFLGPVEALAEAPGVGLLRATDETSISPASSAGKRKSPPAELAEAAG